MLQNARVAAFTVSELLSENKQGEGKTFIAITSIRRLHNVDYRLEILTGNSVVRGVSCANFFFLFLFFPF